MNKEKIFRVREEKLLGVVVGRERDSVVKVSFSVRRVDLDVLGGRRPE